MSLFIWKFLISFWLIANASSNAAGYFGTSQDDDTICSMLSSGVHDDKSASFLLDGLSSTRLQHCTSSRRWRESVGLAVTAARGIDSGF